MLIKQIKNEVFPYITVDDFYSKDEEKLIWKDIDTVKDYLNEESEKSGSRGVAKDENGQLADLHRIYLDSFYNQRRTHSEILKLYSKKLFSDEILESYKIVPSHLTYQTCNSDYSQISYYENKNYYKKHYDVYQHTALIWFYKEPKKFSGGDLKMHDSGDIVECKHNRMILFPSYYLHEVESITMQDEDLNQGLGRYCLTHFFTRA